MPTRRASIVRKAGWLITAMASPACFAVEKIDPGLPEGGSACQSLLIDDFEDGNLVPAPTTLGPWSCDTWSPPRNPDLGQDVACNIEPGDGSRFDLLAAFRLRDQPDTIPNNPSMTVSTSVTGAPVDFSRYRWLVFNTRIDSGAPPLPIGTWVTAAFGCQAVARDSNATFADEPEVDQSAPTTTVSTWQTNRLELANFGQPSWQSDHIEGGAPSCLELVDRITFGIAPPGLTDGRAVSGALHIDDIHVESDCPP